MEAENITKAISAHGQWKERLANAIASGTSDFDPEVVKLPDRCEFGKWLYGDNIPAGAKGSDYYRKALDLHAQFHAEAGTVLGLALQGERAKAEGLMTAGSKFDSLSTTLTTLLNEWKAA
ncbi:MAG: CZB domain-containing protein [Rhodocyclaceae bacterium]|jgi:hypothetical protein